MNTVFRLFKKLIGWITIIVLSWMVILASAQLILSFVFDMSLPWAHLQLRQMVFVICLLGGVLAAFENRHIRIDLLDNYLKGKSKIIARRTALILASVCCLFFGAISIPFINNERKSGVEIRDILFGFDIPQWYVELLIPLSFFLMSSAFLYNFLKPQTSADLTKSELK